MDMLDQIGATQRSVELTTDLLRGKDVEANLLLDSCSASEKSEMLVTLARMFLASLPVGHEERILTETNTNCLAMLLAHTMEKEIKRG
jgi:hypothetical protein